MSMKTVDDIKIGKTISFKSKHPTDSNTYQGKVIGIGTYDTVKNLADLVPYYQRVATKVDLPPMEDLEYIVIQYSQDGKVTKSVFAKDYLDELEFIELDTVFDIRIYDRPYDDANKIVELLKANGFRCKALFTKKN